MKKIFLSLATLPLMGIPLYAGSYFATVDRSWLPTSDPLYVPPFAIVHPIGYTGSGGTIEVSVCVEGGSEDLINAVQFAIDTWNELTPTVDNCRDCVLVEEPPPTTGRLQAASTLLHELGHCALGLDHINLQETTRMPGPTNTGTCDVNTDHICGSDTSFTASVNAEEVMHNPTKPRGHKTDSHTNDCPHLLLPGILQSMDSSLPFDTDGPGNLIAPLGMACPIPNDCCPQDPPPTAIVVQEIGWYRTADNNPVIIDGTVIDKDTFSRSEDNYPVGSNFAANANRGVAEADDLNFPRTQSIMYSQIGRDQRYLSLSADDVNMVKMGMTGADRDADALPDDNYTIHLTLVSECVDADILVELSNDHNDSPGTPQLPGTIGVCAAAIQTSFSQNPLFRHHWSLRPVSGEVWIFVELNPFVNWDFSVPLLVTGFETGDLSDWSAACPPTCAASDPEPPPPLP